jgi:hypothetical protein
MHCSGELDGFADRDVWVPFRLTPCPYRHSWLASGHLLAVAGNPAAKSAWSGGSRQTLRLVAQPAPLPWPGSGCGWLEAR